MPIPSFFGFLPTRFFPLGPHVIILRGRYTFIIIGLLQLLVILPPLFGAWVPPHMMPQIIYPLWGILWASILFIIEGMWSSLGTGIGLLPLGGYLSNPLWQWIFICTLLQHSVWTSYCMGPKLWSIPWLLVLDDSLYTYISLFTLHIISWWYFCICRECQLLWSFGLGGIQ